MNNSISRELVLEDLSKVQEPDLHKDLVTLNMIQNLVIQEDNVSFSIILTTPACPL
jgi:ATP-binding protein involved in chromosome partitioning